MSAKIGIARADFLLPVRKFAGKGNRIEDGYILWEEERLMEVGAYEEEKGKALLRKYGDKLTVLGENGDGSVPRLPGLLLPGFVKGHGHDHESPIIGISKDAPLTTWLDEAVNPFTGFINQKKEELTKRFGMTPHLLTYLKARLDDLSFGITSCLVHHCNHNKYNVEDLAAANRQAGTRMTAAVGSQDRNYVEILLDKPEEAVERMDRYRELFAGEERFRVVPGPDQFFSNGPEILKGLKDWSRKNDTLIHIHSSEEPATTKWFRETYGKTPVEYAEEIGFLDERTILAHQVNCTGNDLEILKRTGTKVVHNPLANTILGSGMPPVMKMMELGIPVAVSTDGSGSADNQNIIAAARLASQYQKALNQDVTQLPAEQLLEMITAIPASFLEINAGSLVPGKDADFILIDTRRPNMTPTRRDNCLENLFWAAAGNEVRYVVAGGRILVDDYRFTTLDESKIKSDVMKLSEMFVEYREKSERLRGTGVHK